MCIGVPPLRGKIHGNPPHIPRGAMGLKPPTVLQTLPSSPACTHPTNPIDICSCCIIQEVAMVIFSCMVHSGKRTHLRVLHTCDTSVTYMFLFPIHARYRVFCMQCSPCVVSQGSNFGFCLPLDRDGCVHPLVFHRAAINIVAHKARHIIETVSGQRMLVNCVAVNLCGKMDSCALSTWLRLPPTPTPIP